MEKFIKFKDRTTVYATSAASHYNEGDAISVHPVQAEALIASGKATKVAPEGTSEKPAAKPKAKK